MFQIIFYETEDGRVPVTDFLDSLDNKMAAKLVGLMEILEEKGPELRHPYSAPVGDGIFELRCKQGSNISRVLYFFYFGGKIILTNGFVKKTQKTPIREIKLAGDRRADWIKRQNPELQKCRKESHMTLKEYKERRLQDPGFEAAYAEIQPEMTVIRAIIDARLSRNLTQKELSEKTGIAQTEISKLENGTRNPSIKLLQRLADGLDMVLDVSFTPKEIYKPRL